MRMHIILCWIIMALIALSTLHPLAELVDFISNSTIELSPTIFASAGETISIQLPEVRKYDRIYLVVDGRINIDDISASPVKTFQFPLRVEIFEHDVFPTLLNQKRYMFMAYESSEEVFLELRLQPLTPYIIKNVEGHMSYRILSNCSWDMICVELSPVRFHVNNYTQIMFIQPYEQIAESDFMISGAVKLIRGRVAYVNIVVMTEKNWYAYKVADLFTSPETLVTFEIDAYTNDLARRRGEFLGENLVAVAIGVGISNALHDEYIIPIVGVGELVIQNGGSTHKVKPEVQELYTFNPKIYVLRKFRPSNNYLVSIMSLTALLISLASITLG